MSDWRGTDPFTVGQVVGEQIRAARVRAGLRQEDIATLAQSYGFPWTRSSVSSLENGARGLSVEELLFVPIILNHLSPTRRVSLRDLLLGKPGYLKLTDRFVMATPSPIIESVLFGGGVEEPFPLPLPDTSEHAPTEAENEAAERLGLDPAELLSYADDLWSGGYVEERDRRLAAATSEETSPRSRQALRGHISRALDAELRDHVAQLKLESRWKRQRRKQGED